MSKAEIEQALYGKKNKYRAVKTEVDGIIFASKKEAARYQHLRMLERTGYIRSLAIQPRFPIQIDRVKICDVVPDFSYMSQDGKLVIEDVKGVRTAMFKLKKRLFEACYPGLRILEL